MPIESLRYHKEENLGPQREIIRGYHREIIHSKGIDAVYFRKDNSFFETLSGGPIANLVYGEETTAVHYLSADVIIYLEVENDSLLMSKFGIESDGDAVATMLIDDFTEQFRDLVGIEQITLQNMTLSAEVCDWNFDLSGAVVSDNLNGYIHQSLSAVPYTSGFYGVSGELSGDISGSVDFQFIRERKLHNQYIKSSLSYDTQATSGLISGIYSGYVDLSGNGYVTAPVSGVIAYYSDTQTEDNAPNWEIAPQVGDFFRIQFDSVRNLHQEYEITRVSDTDLTPGGLNPLMDRYVWKMNTVRRDPSYELNISDQAQEIETESRSYQNNWSEEAANDIFDYEEEAVNLIDGKNAEKVYGDYDNSNSVYGDY